MTPRRSVWISGFWLAFITVTWLALTPQPPKEIAAISDIVLHTIAFAILTFLLAQAHFPTRLWWPILLMALYGPLIEVLQGAFFSRAAEMKDFGVDLIGIAIGIGLFRVVGQWTDAVVGKVLGYLSLEK